MAKVKEMSSWKWLIIPLAYIGLFVIFSQGQSSTNAWPEPSSSETSDYSISSQTIFTNSPNPQANSNIYRSESEHRPSVGDEQPQPSFPSGEPIAGGMPISIPPASTGESVPYLYHGQDISLEDVIKVGGMISQVGSLQQFILYNNKWTQEPTAYWSNTQTNSIIYVDVPQYILVRIKYPDGQIVLKDWGFWAEGYHAAWVLAESKGWCQIALLGSNSGWSNVLWVYSK